MDWTSGILAASVDVEDWIRRVEPDRWQAPYGAAWTNQDLLGHLAAWSDLLVDQILTLLADRPDTIQTVDVDEWNAEEVAKRRGRSAGEVVEEWRRAVRRVSDAVDGLPVEAWHRSWPVAWATDPVSIEALLRLWLRHIAEHRSKMTGAA